MDLDKKSTGTAAFAIVALTVFAIAFNGAFAQSSGMSIIVSADAGSDVFTVSGQTALSNDVTIRVQAPNNDVIFVEQISPDLTGNYMAQINIGSFWKQDGRYLISAQQSTASQYQVSVQVDVRDGTALTTSASESSLDVQTNVLRPTERLTGLRFTADAPEGAVVIGIEGSTDHTHTDITLTVDAPNGDAIAVDQITPRNDGSFETVLNVGCPAWKHDGFHTITLQQGVSNLYKESTEVEIKNCVVVPEFGTVAMLVLAVAVVSIIAISARSRLVMPRL